MCSNNRDAVKALGPLIILFIIGNVTFWPMYSKGVKPWKDRDWKEGKCTVNSIENYQQYFGTTEEGLPIYFYYTYYRTQLVVDGRKYNAFGCGTNAGRY